MKFKMPSAEELAKLSDKEIADLLVAALAEYDELKAISDDDITDEQIDDLEAVGAAVEAIRAVEDTRIEATEARAARIKAAKDKVVDEEPEGEEGDEADAEAPTNDELPAADEEVPDDASEITEPAEVTASATKSVVRRAARSSRPVRRDPEGERKSARELNVASMVASADIDGFSVGQSLDTLDAVAMAFDARFRGMPQSRVTEAVTRKYGVAQIRKKTDVATHITRKMSGEQATAAIEAAALNMDRFDDGIVAAGGWCAPSTTVYNLPGLETISGILSMPEVTIEHGGISFTKGPDYATVYADSDSGFIQTETQAEAGTTKPLYDVECPDFSEVRLDAIGFGLRAGILTNAAWPELIKRYEQILITAHAHKVNASKIARIVTLLGSAVTAGAVGAATTDSLDALNMQATRLRYKYSLAPTAKIEGFAPLWLLEVFRADLSRQNGVDKIAVTDQQIISYFAVRNISLQFVYDFQNLAATGTTWPTTAQVALYTPGAFVAGTADVISLSAIYDTASLIVNTYTGMFMEEGISVFNPVGSGVLVTLNTAAIELDGRTGAANLGLVVLPTS